MAYEILVLVCLSGIFGAAQAGLIPVAAPTPVLAKIDRLDPVPQYSFAYDVQDALTGDSKSQFETRNGDIVQGSYSLIEADGSRRIVDYTADSINGFNAVVNREPAVAAVAAPIVSKTVAESAPVINAPIVARRLVAAPIAAPVAARTIAAASIAAPILSRTVATAPVAAPILSRTVATAPVAAPILSRTVATAPILSRTVATAPVSAPIYQAYTLPRAVATRVGVPLTYRA